MHLRNAILKEHSRAQSLKIAAWIGHNGERFAQLMQLFLHDEYRVVQRAAWIISFVAEKHIGLIIPHLPAMVKRLQDPGIPVAVKRNVLRVMKDISIPKELQGAVMNISFDALADPAETVAVRCWAMTILGNLSKDYPEIKNEVILIIEDQLQHQPTAGFKARAKKVMKMMQL